MDLNSLSRTSPPPKYEVLEMDGTGGHHGSGNVKLNEPGWRIPATAEAAAPLLINDTYGTNFKNGGIIITKEETKREYGPFAFFVKDASTQSLLQNGEVNFKQTATLTGVGSDAAVIEIKEIKTPDKSWTFDVIRGTISLGTIVLDVVKNEISVNTNAMGRNYLVSGCALLDEDLVITKNGEAKTKIKIIKKKGYEPFESTLEFLPTETMEPITDTEKYLFTSVAVICMMLRNGPIFTRAEHNFWSGLGYLIGILIVVGIIVGLYYLFDYLISNCNRPGYRCGKTRY